MSSIEVGDIVTGVTPDGHIVSGRVTDQFDTNAEGEHLTGGPTLIVRTSDGREHPVKLANATRGTG